MAALEFDRLEQPARLVGQRVLATRRVVALHEHRRRRVEVHDRDAMAVGAHAGDVRQQFVVTPTGHQRQAIDPARL